MSASPRFTLCRGRTWLAVGAFGVVPGPGYRRTGQPKHLDGRLAANRQEVSNDLTRGPSWPDFEQMARSSQVQRIIEGLTPEVEAELAVELARRERERARLAAARTVLEQFETEHGPVPEDEVARVRREWPRD
jgi:hypothetical protein